MNESGQGTAAVPSQFCLHLSAGVSRSVSEGRSTGAGKRDSGRKGGWGGAAHLPTAPCYVELMTDKLFFMLGSVALIRSVSFLLRNKYLV